MAERGARADWIAPARRVVFAAHRREGAREWVQATGDSMRPTIRPGTWMLVHFGAPAAPGDIVLLAGDERHVAHRLVSVRRCEGGAVVVTKGDGEPYCDRAVGEDAVLGVIRALRDAPGDAATSTGCVGRRAQAIALSSRGCGRLAGRARRVALRLAPSRRVAALRTIAALSRSATRLFAAVLLGSGRATASDDGR